MYNFIKRIPLLISAVLFLFFEILFFFPRLIFFYIIPLLFWAILIIEYLVFQERIKQFWPLMMQIFLFVVTVFLFLLFFGSRPILYHLFLFSMSVVLFFLFRQINYLFFQPRFYQPYFFEKNSQWYNFIIAFCLFSELYALNVFFQVSIWLLILPCYAFCFWFFYYSGWIQKMNFRRFFFPIILLSLVVVEFYLTLSFLPTTFHINSLLLSIFCAIIFNLWFQKQKEYPLPTASTPRIPLK